MKYNDDAQLDTSGVQDARSGGGLGGILPSGRGGIAVGGGGIGVLGVIIYVIVSMIGGGDGSNAVTDVLGQLGSGRAQTADNSEVAAACKTGHDANTNLDCAVVADIDSIQNYWAGALPKLGKTYEPVPTVWFTGQVSTACGAASSGSGPFYCPGDQRVYLDLSFYDDLKTQFGAQGGLFVDAYVLAHEYGHHVQDLLGTQAKVRPGETGPKSGSVCLELQADCYAGVWARNAVATGYIVDLTTADIADGLDAAGAVGDDRIQQETQGRVNPETWTHGSSAERQKWFERGYQRGEPSGCDTFSGAL
jgi:uncharacterized protein